MIRGIKQDDAEQFMKMLKALDGETEYMMYEADERQANIEGIARRIKGTLEGDDLLLVAEEQGDIVGFLWAERGMPRRIRHTAYIVVGIRKAYRGKGIGTAFFNKLDEWAKVSHVTRLELTVMCPNVVAKHLYEKNGFQVEGVKKNAMIVNGVYVDEFYMAKLL